MSSALKMTLTLTLTLLLASSVVAKPLRDSNPEPSTGVVSQLLSTLLHQTLYSRMESLLLDPGRKSREDSRIVDSAVENYRQQVMRATGTDTSRDEEAAAEGSGRYRENFSTLAGKLTMSHLARVVDSIEMKWFFKILKVTQGSN